MKSLRGLVAAALLIPGAAVAQEVTFGGQIRIRGEVRDPFTLSESGGSSFTSMRARANLLAQLDGGVSVFIQIQDVRTWGEESSTLSDFSANNIDLHQGYLSVGSQGDGFFGRFGRQEVNFGGQRLVGAVNWTQQGRSFDGARLEGAGDWGVVRVLGSRLGNDVSPLVDEDAALVGGYSTINVSDSQDVDAYVLYNYGAEDEELTLASTKQVTYGARWIGSASRLTYRAEGSLQTGDRVGRDVSAFMLGGRLAAAFGDFRATLWYDYLSGSDDPNMGDVKVFDTLFATNHKFYGYADLFLNIPLHTDGRGLQDASAKFSYTPHEDWRVAADVHSFALAKKGQMSSGHLGEEIDLTLSWAHSANFDVSGGVAFVLADEAWAAIGRLTEDMIWGYLMLDAHF
jgi:hypothetical protein